MHGLRSLVTIDASMLREASDEQDFVPPNLSRRIASRLRDDIIAGVLHYGEPLRLMAVARRLSVSTTPVREALIALERQGLVYSLPHRGYYVSRITPLDVGDMYALHAHVSGTLTERATSRLADVDIDALEALDQAQRELTSAGDAPRAAELNYEFHRRINLASGAPLLMNVLRETTPFVTRRGAPDIPGWAEERIDGHVEILSALRKRDGKRAAELMTSHFLRAGEAAVAHLLTQEREVPITRRKPRAVHHP
jgi:DNA-binding GntR family transcriptional regulator